MTWVKLSDDYSDAMARFALSDAAFRTHTEALLWTMRRETGGHIDRVDIKRFAESGQVEQAVTELTDLGLWEVTGDGWIVRFHMEYQPEPDVIARRRELAAERQRRKRRRDVDDEGMSRRDDPRDPGRDGTGRDGTGRGTYEEDLPKRDSRELPADDSPSRAARPPAGPTHSSPSEWQEIEPGDIPGWEVPE